MKAIDAEAAAEMVAYTTRAGHSSSIEKYGWNKTGSDTLGHRVRSACIACSCGADADLDESSKSQNAITRRYGKAGPLSVKFAR